MIIYNDFPCFDTPSVVVVGSFDGLHRGHRLLIDQLNKQADIAGLRAVVITFDPHPRQVLRGENRLLTTIDERKLLFEQAGVEELVIVNFTHEFAAIDAECFVRDYLKGRLRAQIVFTGEGHTFGHNRGGDEEILRKYGITTRRIERYEDISSTRIRQAIDCGDLELAANLLGSHYMVITPIAEPSKLLPPPGRYLCLTQRGEELLDVDDIAKMDNSCILLVKKRA